MQKLISYCVLISIFFWGGTAWAYLSESLIYPGPPEGEEVYDISESGSGIEPRPTAVSWSGNGRDINTQSGWWALGGRINSTWDNNRQGFTYVWANLEKEFEVTASGPAWITFSWDGLFQVNGNSEHDGSYSLYADASIVDTTLGENSNEYWYHDLDSIGTLSVSESSTFSYDFGLADLGEIFEVSLVFQTEVSIFPYGDPDIFFTDNNDDYIEFISSFNNSLKITSISPGIKAVQGPNPVPVPSAIWLLGSGLAGLVGFRIRKQT